MTPVTSRRFMERPLTTLLAISLTFLAVLTSPGIQVSAAGDGDGLASTDDGNPAVYAIKEARIVAAPGKTFEPGTLVVRRGVVERVGPSKEVEIPFDAEVVEGKGLVVYPGFIDLFTTVGQRSGVDRSSTGRGRPVDLAEQALAATPPDNRKGLTPEFDVASVLELPESLVEPRRRLGFTDLLSAPGGAIATGQSALASLSGLPRREAVTKSPVALHIHLAPPSEPSLTGPGIPGTPPAGPRRRFGPSGDGPTESPYPRVLMGSVAHLRQAMLDAQYDHELREALKDSSDAGPRVPYDPALRALWLARTKQLPVWWEADTRDEIHRALDAAAEFGTSALIVGGNEAVKVIDRLKREGVPVVLRLNFPEEPKVPTEAEYAKRPALEQDEPLKLLAHRKAKWKERVATASALAKAGVPFALSSDGLDRIDTLPAQLRALITAGLTPDQLVAALTVHAATIAGVERRLGTLEAGKLGHVAVFTAPLQDEKAKVKFVLVDGLKFEIKALESSPGEGRAGGRRPGNRPSADAGERPTADEPPSPSTPAGAAAKPKSEQPDRQEKPKKSADLSPTGDQKKPDVKAVIEVKPEPKTEQSAGKKTEKSEAKKPDPKPEKKPVSVVPFVDVATEFEADRVPRLKTGGSVLIKDAAILTVTKGTIPRGSILIEKGKITAVGVDLMPGDGVTVIDAKGLVAMPGIIDTHSHIAVQGGVNEFSLSIVPEVRVKDVVTGDDVAIYRALAGGTTTARLLHGSANTIGGQDAVIKLKYGKPGRDLILRGGPQGVKFALGENVTRLSGRFPNTRMGVEAVLERAFDEARRYQAAWEEYRLAKDGKDAKAAVPVPPRRDLRLEALAGMLDGSIRIHSHCYRADEILMLLGTAERFGIRIQSLQHVLEGYKVAAEIAAHGASASTFSDWWAYKVEAFDAIPHNAALLTRAGANVCIKSDSEDLIRHLNLEAAKMVKYGGVTEAQALAMITINPARELGLDGRIGSIEVGKDGDIALFNGHPLDALSRCELSLIDGEVHFQRPEKDGRFGVRPGDHHAMPSPSEQAKDRQVEFTAQPKGVFALVGATLHPVSGPAIANGTLVVSGGKIAALGPAGTTIPPEAQTIDLTGLDVWPGLIDAASTIGLSEVGSLQETQDFADAGRFQPELRTSVALRPDSEHIPVTRANGVLTSYVEPSGGLIAGQGCVINLRGWVPREMVLADAVALSVRIPEYVPRSTESRRPGPGPGPGRGEVPDPQARRKEQLDAIREQFRKAKLYDRMLTKGRAKGATNLPRDPGLEALRSYANGQKPVIFHAQHRNEILDALAIARDLKLKAVISGAGEGWKVAGLLKEAGVPVIVAGSLNLPDQEHDPYDAAYTNAAKLHAAGVSLAIRSKGGGPSAATNGRNLPYEAATAIAFGLPEDEALKAITLTPAQILGVADRVGSLEVGKHATLLVTAGHILQPTTRVLALFIGGKPLSAESRHTQLFEKYSRRLEEVRSGISPLGLERPADAAARPASRHGAASASAGASSGN